MEYVLLAIVLLQSAGITYLLTKTKKNEPLTEAEKELKKREKIEKQWQALFNYSEGEASRRLKDEE